MHEHENFKKFKMSVVLAQSLSPSTIETNPAVDIPSAAQVAKAKQVLQNMVATGQLTSEGEAWLKINTDPWHDTTVNNFQGVPDNYGGQCVTCSVVQEINVSKPAALASGNWNVRVHTIPLANQISVNAFVHQGNTIWETAGPGATLGIWPVKIAFASGTDNFPI